MSEPSDRGPRRREPPPLPGSVPGDRGAADRAVEGTIREALPNAMYAVELDNGQRVLSHVAGSMQTRIVRVRPGDRVTVELSPYDPMRGRITRRHR